MWETFAFIFSCALYYIKKLSSTQPPYSLISIIQHFSLTYVKNSYFRLAFFSQKFLLWRELKYFIFHAYKIVYHKEIIFIMMNYDYSIISIILFLTVLVFTFTIPHTFIKCHASLCRLYEKTCRFPAPMQSL